MRLYIVTKEDKTPFMQTEDYHDRSDFWALDSMWREFIFGAISFLKANELP